MSFLILIKMSIHTKSTYIFWPQKFLKSITHVNPEFIWSYLDENTIPYNLRNENRLLLTPAKYVKFRNNSLIFRRSLLWNNLSLDLKNCQTIDEFKLELKRLGRIHCICTLRRYFLLLAIYRYFVYLLLMYTL